MTTAQKESRTEPLNFDSSATSTLKLDTTSSSSLVESLTNLLSDFKNVDTVNLSQIDFSATTDNSGNSDSTNAGVDVDLSSLPSNITTISIAGNESIKSVKINNTMTEFSATGCANFTGIEFPKDANEASLAAEPAIERLYLANTSITELDVSNCANLETLVIANCGMDGTKLNIDGLTKLITLDISGNKFLKFNAPSSITTLTCDTQTGNINVAPSDSLNMTDVLNATLVSAKASAALAANDSDCANVEITGAWNGDEAVTVSSYSKETGELSLDGVADKLSYTYVTGTTCAAPMDVTVELSGTDSGTGSSSSGCNLGFAALGLVIVLSFFLF